MKKYLLAGILAWLPLGVTIWVLMGVLGMMNDLFGAFITLTQAVLPETAHEFLDKMRQVPGLGVVLVVAVVWITGVFVTNMVGQWWMRQWDELLNRIPIVKSIYSSVKQVSDTLFSSSSNAFREAVMLEYPRTGVWTIAFVTGKPGGEVQGKLPGEHVSVYVPTTPNPTSGFFLMVPRSSVLPLDISVDQALKYIISMGVVVPSPDKSRRLHSPGSKAAQATNSNSSTGTSS